MPATAVSPQGHIQSLTSLHLRIELMPFVHNFWHHFPQKLHQPQHCQHQGHCTNHNQLIFSSYLLNGATDLVILLLLE